MAAPFRLNLREFNQAFVTYMNYSKRDVATALNTKAFFIARRATVLTPRIGKDTVQRELGIKIRTVREKNTDTGRLNKVRRAFAANNAEAPLAALIINARRAAKGQPGLSGRAMERAIYHLTIARKKSRAFIASGWLPAIARLGPISDWHGAPRQDRAPQQIGRPKGGAIPARAVWRTFAQITNSSSTTRDHKNALIQYGQPALQEAVDFEVASMEQYILRKLLASARRTGIRTR